MTMPFLPLPSVLAFPIAVLLALCHKESGNNPRVQPGDAGLARGILQIHAGVIADVNRVYGTAYQWPRDADDPETAKQICVAYLKYWASEKRLGHVAEPDDYARIWNGGPNGWRGGGRAKTDAYAADFTRIYNRESIQFDSRLKEVSKILK